MQLGGTSLRTTAPAPIFELSPTLNEPRILAPAAITTLLPIVGCRFPFLGAPTAQDRALVERDVFADLGGLADDDTHAVIDEAAGADHRARMDLNARQKPGDVSQKPGRKFQAPSSTKNARCDASAGRENPDSRTGPPKCCRAAGSRSKTA